MIGILADRVIIRSNDERLVRDFKGYIISKTKSERSVSYYRLLRVVLDYAQGYTCSATVIDKLFDPNGKFEEVVIFSVNIGGDIQVIERESTN